MKFYKKIIFFIIVIAVSLIGTLVFIRQTVPDNPLQNITEQDKKYLTEFFEELIENQCFGYTLFGNKPVSSAGYFLRPLLNEVLLEDTSGIILRNGGKAWNSNKSNFYSKNFIFKFCSVNNVRHIYLINKSLFISCINQNIKQFKKVLGTEITAQNLLLRLENEDIPLESILQHNHALIGILYGFGTQNSLYFARYSELKEHLYENPFPPFLFQYNESLNQPTEQNFALKMLMNFKTQKKAPQKPLPSNGFQTIIDEYNFLQKRLCPTTQAFFLQRFAPPGFRADPESQETKNLLTSYKDTRKELAKIYSGHDFLKTTLIQFTRQ